MHFWKRRITHSSGYQPINWVSNLTLYSDPVIIPISNGSKFYGSGGETLYIHDMYVLSDKKIRELEPQGKSMDADLKSQQEKIAQLKSQIQEIRNAWNSEHYNAQVVVHNALLRYL